VIGSISVHGPSPSGTVTYHPSGRMKEAPPKDTSSAEGDGEAATAAGAASPSLEPTTRPNAQALREKISGSSHAP